VEPEAPNFRMFKSPNSRYGAQARMVSLISDHQMFPGDHVLDPLLGTLLGLILKFQTSAFEEVGQRNSLLISIHLD
jgi:hypothetical protein